MVLLSGEPGIGKSRLVREVRARLDRRAAHPPALPVLAPPYDQPAASADRAAGARGRLRARRSARGAGSTSWRRCWRAARPPRSGGAADRGAARPADGRPLPGARADARSAEAADAGGAGRAARRARGGAAGAAGVRGRALDRPDHAGAARPGDRAHPAPAGASADHLPARVQPTLVEAAARQLAGAHPARAARRRAHGGPGGRRQDAAGGGERPDRGQDRRRAAVRRGADQDGARVRAARRDAGDHYELAGPAAAARDPGNAARLHCSPASTASPR